MAKRFRLASLLLIPLILVALLGGVQWKRLHPTPTSMDLWHRAQLREATSVEVDVDGRKISLPVSEFKATLNDFFLLDFSNANSTPFPGAVQIPWSHVTITAWKDRRFHVPLAELRMDAPTSYLTNYPQKGRNGEVALIQMMASLHPVTQRRLRELIAKHLPTK